MAFTNEILVRQRGLMRLFDEVPSDLLVRCINAAHSQVIEATTGIPDSEPPEIVIEAETDLVLAELLRVLAVSREINQQPYRTPDLSFRNPGQSNRLLALADMEESRAWSLLQPYLKDEQAKPFALERPAAPQDTGTND
ncbi:MAG: hypothetical protein ABIH23_28805 [bacterium]